MESRIKLISLTSSIEMTEMIAKELDAKIVDSKTLHFADGEILFEAHESLRGDNVYIIQSTCAPVNDRLMEILLAIDACKRASAKSITVVMPYFGYARQERMAKPRQPISARLVADLLTVAGADRIVAADLHAAQIAGFFKIPVDDVSARTFFYHYFRDMNLPNMVVVSPDHGGTTRASRLASMLECPIAIIDKRRPRPNESEVIGVVGDIVGKNCIIIDDMVDTAGTLCHAADKLKEMGAASVRAAITHGVLSGLAVERINASALEELIITDSIPLPEEKKSPKIKVLKMAPLFARMILAIEEGKSMEKAVDDYAEEK